MSVFGILTNQITLEVVIGFSTVVIGTLVAQSILSRRQRPSVEITPVSSKDRLGFRIKVKKRTLDHPRILFYPGWTLAKYAGEVHPCEIFDENGGPYKDDFIIAGGRPVSIFPLEVKREVTDSDGRRDVVVRVFDPKAPHHDVIVQRVPPVPMKGDYAMSFPRDPDRFDLPISITIQVSAQGLEREEVQRFRIALETVISGYTTQDFGDHEKKRWDCTYFHVLHAKKEPRLWWLH